MSCRALLRRDGRNRWSLDSLRLWHLSGWEVLLFLVTLYYVLPRTLASRLVEALLFLPLDRLGMLDIDGGLTVYAYSIVYFVGYALLLALLVKCLYLRIVGQEFALSSARFADAFCLFSVLYLLDFFVSTASPFSYLHAGWVFFALMPCLAIALFFDRHQAVRLSGFLVVVIAVQSLYAIAYYVLGIEQFHTPRFGNRTGGTLADPNALYTLCLLGIPLAITLGEAQASARRRWMFRACGVVIGLALLLTFTRSGWLALLVSLLYLSLSSNSPLRKRQLRPVFAVPLLAAMLAATLLVRTKGEPMGNPSDRSFWGRTAIWQVAARAVLHHPWLGSGVNTYWREQREHMTPRLKRFGPLNVEAKSLYLNLAVEQGIVGLMAFAFLAWRYVGLYRSITRPLEPSTEVGATVVGIHAGIIGLALAGLVDTPILQRMRAPATLAIALLLGVLVILGNEAQPRSTTTAQSVRRRHRRFWASVAVGSLAVISVIAWLLVMTVSLVRSTAPILMTEATTNLHSPNGYALPEVPETVRDAVVAVEDAGFYQHSGVDWQALHDALRHNIRAIRMVQDGGTISMQLTRSALPPGPLTLPRQLAEIRLALQLEEELSKDQLLELYLSRAGFGLGAHGVGTASRAYFGRSPRDLSLGQIAFLAGVLAKPPSTREWITRPFVERCQRRALDRLHYSYPLKYPGDVIRRAAQERLVFAWEKCALREKRVP